MADSIASESQSTSHDDSHEVASSAEVKSQRGPVLAWWILGLCLASVIASTWQIFSEQRERGYFLFTLCVLVCGVAAWLDVATRRIPNRLNYPAILIGLGINTLLVSLLRWMDYEVALVWIGSSGAVDTLLGFAVAAGIGILSFMARGLGGGDVKLLGAVAALIGLTGFVSAFLNALIIAAVMGILNWAVKGTLVPRLQVVAFNLFTALVTKSSSKEVYPFKGTETPFGLALFLGLVIAPWFSVYDALISMVS